jgi:hypothetical protein
LKMVPPGLSSCAAAPVEKAINKNIARAGLLNRFCITGFFAM